jgi:cation diffusion facilitator CzcD-associated flavoprotein CzcO
LILGGVRIALGLEYDIATHFTPRYNPWDQRLCLVPDGDLFKSIRDQRASVVTNQIDTFTQKSIRLKDGSELEADIIVTATGPSGSESAHDGSNGLTDESVSPAAGPASR